MKKTGVAIVGCGNISGIYFKNLCEVFNNVEVKACADLEAERVAAKLEEYPEVKAATLEEILADPEIEIVVNLTTPQGHAPVAMQVIEAGKSVHNEKPLVLTREEGKTVPEGTGETLRAVELLEYYGGEARRITGETFPSG
ncbi:MAG: Gfo/Idh/MocA family oxidoreductase, partial [Verrucomicrobia bacterium]|nr:Gfo/Idh/MocA family oxidoreductase [Verrucomicrobiota bacterium]